MSESFYYAQWHDGAQQIGQVHTPFFYPVWVPTKSTVAPTKRLAPVPDRRVSLLLPNQLSCGFVLFVQVGKAQLGGGYYSVRGECHAPTVR
jgi:hypothetical protein